MAPVPVADGSRIGLVIGSSFVSNPFAVVDQVDVTATRR